MVTVKRLAFGGLCTFSFGFVVYIVGFPTILKSQVKSQISLKKGSEIRDFWEKLPQPLDFNIYIFNVTNPDAIESGEKPIVKEIGPFHYDLYRDKENIVDREEDDSVEYNLRQLWYFNPDKSVLPEDAEIYMFHPIMLATVLITLEENPSALEVVDKAFESIFNDPKSIFIKTSVKELFFYGVPINCTVEDFSGSAVCAALEDKKEILIEEEESIYRYGYLAKQNGSYVPHRIRVSRGIKHSGNVGRVLSINNETKMDIWPGSPCNNIRGTDGTIFPPFLTKDKEVWAHFPDICRSIGAYYVDRGKVQGFKTLHYTSDFGDPSVDANMRCLCLEPEGCMPKNVFNVEPCFNVPLRLSLPHFYATDPQYLNLIDGLNPDPEKHAMTFDFDAMTGTPIKAYKRIQFNAIVGPVPKIRLMKSFPELLFPLFWVEDGLELGDILIKPLKAAYKQILIARTILCLIMISGIGIVIRSLVKYYAEKNKKHNNLNLEESKVQSPLPPFQTPAISNIQPGMVPLNID